MNGSQSPSMGNVLTLSIRPSKRSRSPSSSSEEEERLAKRLCEITLDNSHANIALLGFRPFNFAQSQPPSPRDISTPLIRHIHEHRPNNNNSSPSPTPAHSQQAQNTNTLATHAPIKTSSTTSSPSSKIDPSQLNYPAMLLRKAKRKGLPIHQQFIHPGFFVRSLDQKHPNMEFTLEEYREAWHYAVELARRNLDFSCVRPVGVRAVEREMKRVHCLIEKVRLKTKAEYAASKQAASMLWANADSERFQELLASKRERRKDWRIARLADGMA